MSNSIPGASWQPKPLSSGKGAPNDEPSSPAPRPSSRLSAGPEQEYALIANLLEHKKLCIEACVYRTPSKTGSVYWFSSLFRRPRPNGTDEQWAIFEPGWKPIESDIAIKERIGTLEPGIDLVIRMLPQPDVPHGFCYLACNLLGPSQRIECAGYAIIYTVIEKPSGGRAVKVDSIAIAMEWIRKELRERTRTGRQGWFKELGLLRD